MRCSKTVERHGVNGLTIVGDSFAKPLIKALDEGKPDGSMYDMSSIKMMNSSGVMWTTEVKQDLIDRIEQVILIDAMGFDRRLNGHPDHGQGNAHRDGQVHEEPTRQGLQ